MAALTLLAPVAWACATCFDPKDQTQSAFLGPTIVMSLLPLTMMAGIGAWLWWAKRRREAEDAPRLLPTLAPAADQPRT